MKEDITAKLIYPDPFKPAGLEFELPDAAKVTVTLTDSNGGVLVTLLYDVDMGKGIHKVCAPLETQSGEPAYIKLMAKVKNECIEIVKKLT